MHGIHLHSQRITRRVQHLALRRVSALPAVKDAFLYPTKSRVLSHQQQHLRQFYLAIQSNVTYAVSISPLVDRVLQALIYNLFSCFQCGQEAVAAWLSVTSSSSIATERETRMGSGKKQTNSKLTHSLLAVKTKRHFTPMWASKNLRW